MAVEASGRTVLADDFDVEELYVAVVGVTEVLVGEESGMEVDAAVEDSEVDEYVTLFVDVVVVVVVVLRMQNNADCAP